MAEEAAEPASVTQAATDRAAELGVEITAAPAESEGEVPECFGEFDPSTYPCSPCVVRPDCQLECMGLA